MRCISFLASIDVPATWFYGDYSVVRGRDRFIQSGDRRDARLFKLRRMDLDAQDPPQSSSEATLADATGSPTTSAPISGQKFRVDELALARLVDEGFEEGHQALSRLRAALELLERSERACGTENTNGMDGSGGAAAATGPGDVYSMMVAIERQTGRVERQLDRLSSEALHIVSSALVEVDGDGVDDRVGDWVGGHQPGNTSHDDER